jgi:ABC-type sugar transport system substrate-binding protein
MNRRKSRARKSELAGFSGFALVLFPSLLLFGVILLCGFDFGLALGIAGSVLAVGTFAVTQYQTRRPRTRRIVFLAKSRSSFARNIFRGLTDGLEEYGDIHVSGLFPDPDDGDATAFQLKQLRSLDIARADGVVVIPSSENEETWLELARIMRRGTVVVCVDTKPPNQFFRQQGLAPPLFVGSDFTLGGRMVGRYFAEQLEGAVDSKLVVALGPESSWPGRERGSWILYELAAAGLLSRCEAVELSDWTASACADRLHTVVETAATDGCAELFVFAGNDKLAFALHQRLERSSGPARTAAVCLVGYDGTTTEDGQHLLEGLERARATVDALPFEQGLAAAEFIAWAYEGHPSDCTKRIVAPRFVELNPAVQPVL